MRRFDVLRSQARIEAEIDGVYGISNRLLWVAVIALVLAACVGQQTSSETSPQVDTSTSTTAPVVPDAVDTDEALVAADEFFAALNAGDESGLFDLLADDAVITDSLAGELDPEESRNWLVWRMAQGTNFDDVGCTSSDSGNDSAVVSCETAMQDALATATNTSAALVDSTLEVRLKGISSVDFSYQPTIGQSPSVFVDWLEAQYPDDSGAKDAADIWGDSIEVSRERGFARAEYAQLWADFALASVEETFTLYESKDLEGFLGRWGSSPIIGDNRLSEPEWFEADFESGPSYSLGSCSPDGLNLGLVVHCMGSVVDLFGGRSGIVVETDWVFTVDESGLIAATNDSTDYEPLMQFGNQLQDWMTANYPEIQDSVKWIRPWLAAAEDWDTVRPYVDEFIAQSDDYPVDG